MDLESALQTTGAVRTFSDEPVPDELVHHLLDTARFAPSGGNRQAWKVILVKDPGTRKQLRDLYVKGWLQYLSMGAAGLVPWAPITDKEAEARALAGDPPSLGPGLAEDFDKVPVLLVILANLRALAAVDRDLDRYTLVGGASIYPFAWSVLLAGHGAGLGGVMTTMLVASENEVREMLGVPEDWAIAATLAMGYPLDGKRPTKLRRNEVADFTTIDRYDGPALHG